MRRFTRTLLFSVTALSVISLSGCELLKGIFGGEPVCLDELLALGGFTREDLDEAGADEIVADVLAAQEAVLGKSIVKDCNAEDALSALSDGGSITVDGAGDLGDTIIDLVQDKGGQGMEVAILLDTTCSMRDDQAAVNRALDEILSNVEAQDGTVSMASFGDNWGCDDPWYSRNAGGFLDPSSDSALVGDQLMSGMRQTDGCDWPESLYDGVWKTADELPWSASNRLLIAITDAAPLEPPYTNHTASQVVDKLVEREIVLSTILVGVSY
jgi:hypothetical protein